ncbi:sulfite exporter TauE/SafE family protein [Massilia sp. W12]|uniref:sulfite exporter TauE/SafE family protein n=1 Tax=Massilia sp. W12 TaxID=3126507 RepID=UPI0030D1927D
MKLRDWDYSENALNAEHQKLGLPPLERAVENIALADASSRTIKVAVWLATASLLLLCGYALVLLFDNGVHAAKAMLSEALHSPVFWSALAVGLLAQVVDGALGMAYGITSTSFLMASGVSPAVASASVHVAEVFTTGVSGISHAKFGNVNKKLFLKLLLPGMTGVILGAYILTSIDGAAIKPFIAAYLLCMGLYILSKVFKKVVAAKKEPKHIAKLALFGGFVDATGGGGWGPVVTTTLVGTGQDPRTTIGTVNFAEFFLTLVSAITFTALVGFGPWMVVAGLVIGGLFAAPFAAYLCSKFQTKTLLILVGSLISVVSIFNLYKALT